MLNYTRADTQAPAKITDLVAYRKEGEDRVVIRWTPVDTAGTFQFDVFFEIARLFNFFYQFAITESIALVPLSKIPPMTPPCAIGGQLMQLECLSAMARSTVTINTSTSTLMRIQR
jgi:hypothetical protein